MNALLVVLNPVSQTQLFHQVAQKILTNQLYVAMFCSESKLTELILLFIGLLFHCHFLFKLYVEETLSLTDVSLAFKEIYTINE